MSAKKVLYIFSQAPYSNSTGLEGLDAVLVGAAFEQQISLLFLNDGVFQLKKQQDVSSTPIKEYTKTFLALNDFEIDNAYTHDLSMQARGLQDSDLIIATRPLTSAQVSDLIAEQYRVFTF